MAGSVYCCLDVAVLCCSVLALTSMTDDCVLSVVGDAADLAGR